jgi:hypothetical protein
MSRTPRRINLGDTVRLASQNVKGRVTGTMTLQDNVPAAPLRRSVCVLWPTGLEWLGEEAVVLVEKAKR